MNLKKFLNYFLRDRKELLSTSLLPRSMQHLGPGRGWSQELGTQTRLPMGQQEPSSRALGCLPGFALAGGWSWESHPGPGMWDVGISDQAECLPLHELWSTHLEHCRPVFSLENESYYSTSFVGFVREVCYVAQAHLVYMSPYTST